MAIPLGEREAIQKNQKKNFFCCSKISFVKFCLLGRLAHHSALISIGMAIGNMYDELMDLNRNDYNSYCHIMATEHSKNDRKYMRNNEKKAEKYKILITL